LGILELIPTFKTATFQLELEETCALAFGHHTPEARDRSAALVAFLADRRRSALRPLSNRQMMRAIGITGWNVQPGTFLRSKRLFRALTRQAG